MKTLVSLILLLSTLIACNSGKNSNGGDESESSKKNITKRDYSITPAIAYNDLFLDSNSVEEFMTENKVPDSLVRRIRSFYNSRNYQFAWFSSNGLTEQARGFWNLHSYYTKYSDDSTLDNNKLKGRMENYITEEDFSPSATNKSIINTELILTQHFIHYTLTNYEKGYVKRKEMERFIPAKKLDALYLADSLLTKKHKDDKYFEDVNESYRLLKEQLGKYYTIAKNGGWPSIVSDKKTYKKGESDPIIQIIKKRLEITGDLAVKDTSAVFNDTLENAIKNFQLRYGFKSDGKITAGLVKEMNVPAEERVKQILMNMERMRWMPSRPEGNMILVNIPEFVLHVFNGKQKEFDMAVVVGKEGHNTMMFRGDLNQVVFSPYWNVPSSIVEKEILPELDKNPDYLEKENMEVTGKDAEGLPEIRQRPGPKNSLGKVKFLFPNSFNIYFHDTPAKDLFNRNKRAYSHGCIRLSEPEKMANYLLRNDASWTPERIHSAMNSGEEKYVKLKDPVPVFITYYTAWVDENGVLNLREDIYQHDKQLSAKMFGSLKGQPLAIKTKLQSN
ncbi:MAG TPA: L,D-transpeptidase family protein [Chitinophagaceae bacterium]|nr:L,D-transpeptidase family protein [Chitinophagaceae bacterium]